MICPKCGAKSIQYHGSVKNKKIPEVYRCRICTDCKNIFYTLETVVEYEGEFKRQWREAQSVIETRYRIRKEKNHV